MGLLGSDYFARRPGVGAGRIVANVNLDMPLMLYPFEDVVAFGAERSTLGATAKEAAREAGVRLAPDPFPEEGIFTRSDHFRFVEQGVPAIYLFAGFAAGGEAAFGKFMKERYHRPSDDLSQAIDYEAAARFADLNFRIAAEIADADRAPAWRAGDYFGAMFFRP
jgi:Zn-dependent M28 family amino/carboxypeptidase